MNDPIHSQPGNFYSETRVYPASKLVESSFVNVIMMAMDLQPKLILRTVIAVCVGY